MEWDFRKIAENLNIACSTAQATHKLFERTGGVNPRGQPSRTDTRSLNDTEEIYIVGLVLQNPSMYLQIKKYAGKSHPLLYAVYFDLAGRFKWQDSGVLSSKLNSWHVLVFIAVIIIIIIIINITIIIIIIIIIQLYTQHQLIHWPTIINEVQ